MLPDPQRAHLRLQVLKRPIHLPREKHGARTRLKSIWRDPTYGCVDWFEYSPAESRGDPADDAENAATA